MSRVLLKRANQIFNNYRKCIKNVSEFLSFPFQCPSTLPLNALQFFLFLLEFILLLIPTLDEYVFLVSRTNNQNQTIKADILVAMWKRENQKQLRSKTSKWTEKLEMEWEIGWNYFMSRVHQTIQQEWRKFDVKFRNYSSTVQSEINNWWQTGLTRTDRIQFFNFSVRIRKISNFSIFKIYVIYVHRIRKV